LFRRDIERDILPYTRAHAIGVLVHGPLGHGLLGGGYTPQTTVALQHEMTLAQLAIA
jgi:aryl-alcohol dehydrogenase-like predicted oxidoreductase